MLEVRLVSTSRFEVWEGPVKEADLAPAADNSNGLYAAKGWDSHILPCQTDRGEARVLGRVGLYGTVIEAQEGYRAEKAVIEELWLIDARHYLRLFESKQAALPLETIREMLARRYQVDVHDGWPGGRKPFARLTELF